MGAKYKGTSWNMSIVFPYTWSDLSWFLLSVPNERSRPQLWTIGISDSSEARNRRMENNQACLHSVMEVGRFITKHKSIFRNHICKNSSIDANLISCKNVKMVFMEFYPDFDLRRYNTPTSRTGGCCNICRKMIEPSKSRYLHLSVANS
ncbi:hypothetical protein AVEN_268268-1 [Araneus ventricosus]|uniref:Uncharacterized protein n=1 Tax=Araneus ventricosus TaxID=182803 RepID=A0A4Y2C238_ARAVE|nr:hypothetical protein AVEN_268268-1 [Araneus ventricosus]